MAIGTVSDRSLPLTNVHVGRVKLTGGTVAVALPGITDNSLLFVSGNGSGVTGFLTTTITAGTGWAVTSSVGGDAGFVSYMVVILQQAT